MDLFQLVLVVLGIGTLIILIVLLREVVLWFWRVNDVIKRLDRLIESNERIAAALTRPPAPTGSSLPSNPAPARSAPGGPGPSPAPAAQARVPLPPQGA